MEMVVVATTFDNSLHHLQMIASLRVDSVWRMITCQACPLLRASRPYAPRFRELSIGSLVMGGGQAVTTTSPFPAPSLAPRIKESLAQARCLDVQFPSLQQCFEATAHPSPKPVLSDVPYRPVRLLNREPNRQLQQSGGILPCLVAYDASHRWEGCCWS